MERGGGGKGIEDFRGGKEEEGLNKREGCERGRGEGGKRG